MRAADRGLAGDLAGAVEGLGVGVEVARAVVAGDGGGVAGRVVGEVVGVGALGGTGPGRRRGRLGRSCSRAGWTVRPEHEPL